MFVHGKFYLLYSSQPLKLFQIYFLIIHGHLENYVEDMYFLKCMITYCSVLLFEDSSVNCSSLQIKCVFTL